MKSIGAQRKALEQSKEFSEAYFWLGTAYNAKGEVEKAIEAYNGAIANRRGPYPDAHYNLGLAHQRIGELDKAISSYRAALAENEDFPAAHYSLGAALLETGSA